MSLRDSPEQLPSLYTNTVRPMPGPPVSGSRQRPVSSIQAAPSRRSTMGVVRPYYRDDEDYYLLQRSHSTSSGEINTPLRASPRRISDGRNPSGHPNGRRSASTGRDTRSITDRLHRPSVEGGSDMRPDNLPSLRHSPEEDYRRGSQPRALCRPSRERDSRPNDRHFRRSMDGESDGRLSADGAASHRRSFDSVVSVGDIYVPAKDRDVWSSERNHRRSVHEELERYSSQNYQRRSSDEDLHTQSPKKPSDAVVRGRRATNKYIPENDNIGHKSNRRNDSQSDNENSDIDRSANPVRQSPQEMTRTAAAFRVDQTVKQVMQTRSVDSDVVNDDGDDGWWGGSNSRRHVQSVESSNVRNNRNPNETSEKQSVSVVMSSPSGRSSLPRTSSSNYDSTIVSSKLNDLDLNGNDKDYSIPKVSVDAFTTDLSSVLVPSLLQERPDKRYICTICTRLLFEPVMLPCSHVCCLACIRRWYDHGKDMCPYCRRCYTDRDGVMYQGLPGIQPASNDLKRDIGSLKMICPHNSKGCGDEIFVRDLPGHLSVCVHEMVRCQHCLVMVVRSDLNRHEDSCLDSCIYEPLGCSFRGVRGGKVADHSDTCWFGKNIDFLQQQKGKLQDQAATLSRMAHVATLREAVVNMIFGRHAMPSQFTLGYQSEKNGEMVPMLISISEVRGGAGSAARVFQKFLPIEAEWITLPPHPRPRVGFARAICQWEIYILGGFSSTGEYVGRVEVLDNSDCVWYKAPSLAIPRSGLAAVAAMDVIDATQSWTIYAAGGFDGREHLSLVEIFIVKTETWVQGPPMLHRRANFSLVVLNNYLYALGGWDGTSCLNSVERLPLNGLGSRRWESVAPMIYKSEGLTALVVQGALYVSSGWDGDTYITTVERYVEESNQWVTSSSDLFRSKVGAVDTAHDITVTNTRSGTPAAALSLAPHKALQTHGIQSAIYAVGGYDGVNVLSSVERYFSSEDHWVSVVPMRFKRQGHAVASFRGRLYCIGGWDGRDVLDVVERFDPSTNAWTTLNSLKVARAGLAAVTVRGELFILGGWDGINNQRMCERYDWTTDSWVTVAAMKSRRYGLGAAAVGDNIVAVGGGHATVEVYSVSLDQWRMINEAPSMKGQYRQWLGCVGLLSSVFVLGGYDGSTFTAANDRADFKNIDNNEVSWVEGTPMTTARYGLAAVVFEGNVYVLGGLNGNERLDSLDRFEVGANRWRACERMLSKRHNAAAAVL